MFVKLLLRKYGRIQRYSRSYGIGQISKESVLLANIGISVVAVAVEPMPIMETILVKTPFAFYIHPINTIEL
jgi:hypothetical protein